jgi:hypothetical protein
VTKRALRSRGGQGLVIEALQKPAAKRARVVLTREPAKAVSAYTRSGKVRR